MSAKIARGIRGKPQWMMTRHPRAALGFFIAFTVLSAIFLLRSLVIDDGQASALAFTVAIGVVGTVLGARLVSRTQRSGADSKPLIGAIPRDSHYRRRRATVTVLGVVVLLLLFLGPEANGVVRVGCPVVATLTLIGMLLLRRRWGSDT
jgi:archaellum biogenesis protein FlaJ (TadC family)